MAGVTPLKRVRSGVNGETPKRQRSEEDLARATIAAQDLCVDDELKTLRFQQQVMYKRVKQKQDELTQLDRTIQTLANQRDQLNDLFAEVHQTWELLASDLRAVCQELVVKSADVDLLQTLSGYNEKKNPLFPFVELFCSKAETPEETETNGTDAEATATIRALRESLSATALQTQEVVRALVQALNEREEESRAMNQTIRQLIEEGGSVENEAMLLSQNDKLATESENLKGELAELQRAHRKQTTELAELRKKVTGSLVVTGEVRAEAEALRWDLVRLQRKYDTAVAAAAPVVSAPPTPVATDGLPSTPVAAPPPKSERVEELQFELEEVKQISENRLAELDQLRAQCTSLQNQVSDLKIAAQPAELAAVSFHRQILALKQELATIKALYQKTAIEAKKEAAARAGEELAWNESLSKYSSQCQERERELQHQLDEVTSQLTKAESERDEIRAKLDADGNSSSLIGDYTSTNQAFVVQIAALKEEIAALQEARDIKSDARVRHFLYRRCISKQKANEAKEAELKATVGALKESSESELSALREQLAELRGIAAKQETELESYKARVEELSQQAEADDLRSELADQKATAEELTTMLDDMAKTNEDTQDQNQKLVNQCHALEKAIAKLTSSNKKNQQLHNLLRQEKELIARKCDVQVERGKAAAVLMKEETERIKTMNEQRTNWKKQVDTLESEMQIMREAVREKTTALEQTKDDLQKKTKGFGEASQRLSKELKDSEEREKKLRQLSEKNASLTRKVDRARAKAVAAQEAQAAASQSAAEATVDRVLEAELRLLKQRDRKSVV